MTSEMPESTPENNEPEKQPQPIDASSHDQESSPAPVEAAAGADTNEAQAQEQVATGPLSEDRVREELKKVIDPELFVNIVDLGLIYEVSFSDSEEQADKKNVHINMTMTSPMCPAGPQLIADSKRAVGGLSEVANVEVKIVLDPPWTPDKMSEDARDQLGIF